CVCSRSQGHPLGARNRACSATSFSNHFPASLSRPLRGMRASAPPEPLAPREPLAPPEPLARTFAPIREPECAEALARDLDATVFAIFLRRGKRIPFCVTEGTIYREAHRVTSSEWTVTAK